MTIQSPSNTIGGTTPGARNVISGNTLQGVRLITSGATLNVVQGNYIGTDASGTAALGNGGNGIVMNLGASGNQIGGTATGAGNVASGKWRQRDLLPGCGHVKPLAPGTGPKSTIDVLVDRAVGGNPFKPFGTWSTTF